MRHIQNDYMKVMLQNALLAEEVAEAAKLRQSEKARSRAADAVENLEPQTEEPMIKKVPGNAADEKDGSGKPRQGSRNLRYRTDGSLEEDGAGPPAPPAIDFRI